VKRSLHRRGLIKIFQTSGSGSIAIDPLMLLFTKYKTTCLTIISIYCLAASPAKDVWGQQPHLEKHINCRNLKWTLEGSLPYYCYAAKSNSRTMRSQVSQRESADEGTNMSALQAHHCITPEQSSSWLLCSVSAIPVKMPVSPPLLRQPRSQALRFGGEKYIFRGARFFILCFNLGGTKNWGHCLTPVTTGLPCGSP